MTRGQLSFGLELPTLADAAPDRPSRRNGLAMKDLSHWAHRQVTWIARRSHADRSSDLFLFSQAAKLVEEVGELHAQLLGRSRQQAGSKSAKYSPQALEDEVADVLICAVILADVAGVDIISALERKMAEVDRRVAGGETRSSASRNSSGPPRPRPAVS